MAETIRGVVYDNFCSLREFSAAIGWNRNKACNIVNGKREPKISDLSDMSRVLNVPVEKLAPFFLQDRSQNSDD